MIQIQFGVGIQKKSKMIFNLLNIELYISKFPYGAKIKQVMNMRNKFRLNKQCEFL